MGWFDWAEDMESWQRKHLCYAVVRLRNVRNVIFVELLFYSYRNYRKFSLRLPNGRKNVDCG